MSWFNYPLLDQAREDLENLEGRRDERKGIPYKTEAEVKIIKRDIAELRRIVRVIQKNGVSMWNYKEVLPRIFEVISGAFDVVEDIADEIESVSKRLDYLEKKVGAIEAGLGQAFDKIEEKKK